MTDAGRKDLGDKIHDKVTPDKSKSTIDKVGDALTGAGDKAARDVVPDSQKSTSQAAQDKLTRGKDNHTGDSVLDKAANTLTGTGASAGDKVARDAVPDSQKSTGQAAQDKASRDTDANKGGDSILDKAKAAVGMDHK